MRIKVVSAIVGLVWISGSVAMGQTYSEEALMLSRISPGGTARIQGMGGVQNSLGGDLSSAYYNPAGLGMYNRSDFQITPGYAMSGIGTSYLGNSASTNQNNLMLANLGIAFHTSKDGEKGLWGGTFAINFNRTNNFNESFTYSALNKDNSIIDYFIQDANGSGTSQFDTSGSNYNTPTGLSYFNYLIGPQSEVDANAPNDQYFTYIYPYLPTQTETVKNSGSQSQWTFSYGVNYNDKLFFGFGIGLASFKYKSQKTYTETFLDPYNFPDGTTGTSPMSKMVLNETLDLSGSAINATFGAIFRPVDEFQFGLSAATPSGYLINDSYNASMQTTWNNFTYPATGKVLNNEAANTDIVSSTYTLSSPWRVTGGATYFFQKNGFISADAEWVNYGATHFSSTTGDNWSADNQNIKDLYKSIINLRVGGEYRMKEYRFRAGYRLMPDPFQSAQNGVDRSLSSYTAGVGYRKTSFYIDMAVVYTTGSNSYRPYHLNSPYSPLVNLSGQATTVMFTVGFPF